MADPEKSKRSELDGKSQDELFGLLADMAENNSVHKNKQLGDDAQSLESEKVVFLRVVDCAWTDVIDAMDVLRQSIGCCGYGQMNPLVEYVEEGYRMFEEMMLCIDDDVTRLSMKAEIWQNIAR